MSAPEITPLHVGASGYVAGVVRQLQIAKIVNRLVRWDEVQWKRSPGTLVTALIINMLMGRRPLYRVWEAFENLDLPVLFDEPISLKDLNDDAFGRTLDRLHESGNMRRLIHSVALEAVNDLPLGIRSVHADTTSISLCGEYEWTETDQTYASQNPDQPPLHVTYGYSKDRRPDLKQFVYGLVVSGEGMPLMGNVRDGNTSDKVWNLDVIDEIQQSFFDPQNIIYVADSAFVTAENLAKINQHSMRFISRLPETYKLAATLKAKAWSEGAWEHLGPMSVSGQGAIYQAQSFIDVIDECSYRFVVVHSSALDKRKMKSIDKKIERERTQLSKAIKEVERERFHCREDAEQALDLFLKEQGQSVHTLAGEVHEERTLKRPPGRPAKGFVPEEVLRWRLHFTLTAPTPEALAEIYAQASTFILITNLHEEEWDNADILREYKGQSSVETRFRNLKAQPCIVDNIYVKSSRRAEALAYLFLLALIVASFIEIRIRQELKERNAEFLVPGKRWTNRPTMTMLFDILETVLVVIEEHNGGVRRFLPRNTDSRVKQILELTGLDEGVYTQVRRE